MKLYRKEQQELATATSYAVTGLTVGQGYYFGVTAGNN